MKLKKLSIIAFIGMIFSMSTISFVNAENKLQYVNSNQEITRSFNGWTQDFSDNWLYYKNDDILAGEWLKDKGKWYYFSDFGYMIRDQVCNINGKNYIFGKDGALIQKKGWVRIKEINFDYNDEGYYYAWYYANGDGTVKISQWVKDKGNWYYVNDSGIMMENIVYDINGKNYVFGTDGVLIEKKVWIKISYDPYYEYYWYYGNGDGTVKSNQWVKDGSKWYYFDENGVMINRGTINLNNKCYLFDENGVMIKKKGWIKVMYDPYNNIYGWYYGNGDGTVKVNQYIDDNGTSYYVDNDGVRIDANE